MNEKISDSIKFLLLEYKRLVKKKKTKILNKSDKETLDKLTKFFGKKNDF